MGECQVPQTHPLIARPVLAATTIGAWTYTLMPTPMEFNTLATTTTVRATVAYALEHVQPYKHVPPPSSQDCPPHLSSTCIDDYCCMHANAVRSRALQGCPAGATFSGFVGNDMTAATTLAPSLTIWVNAPTVSGQVPVKAAGASVVSYISNSVGACHCSGSFLQLCYCMQLAYGCTHADVHACP